MTHSHRCRMAASARLFLVCAAIGWLAGLSRVQAQEAIEDPVVTAVSHTDGVTMTPAQGAAQPVLPNLRLSGQVVDVAGQRQIMIYSQSGAAVIAVLGPARFRVAVGEARIDVELMSGQLMAMSDVAADRQPVHVTAPTQGGAAAADATIAPGVVYVERDANQIQFGYSLDGGRGQAMTVNVGNQPTPVPAGQRLTIRGANVQTTPIGSWLTDRGFDAGVLQTLGVASARSQRPLVHDNLFENIITWDREAKATERINILVVREFRQEIRQTAVAVTTAQVAVSNRGAAPTSPSVANVKTVPLISPAAISVGGVTAVTEANQNAQNVLQGLQSRGLGTGGLGLLLVPGLSNGVRNLGPSGIATPRHK